MNSKQILISVLALAAVSAVPGQAAENTADPHAHHHHQMAMDGDMSMPGMTRAVADYKVPDVQLVRDDGKTVSLREELDDGRPVALNFIYTTCTAICPVTSTVFSQLQAKLGSGQGAVHLVSISIDPEQDTPPALREYARKYGAGPAWQHYTGTAEASLAVQRAFDAYRGDKMNHTPLTLIRLAPGKPWIRLDGFATANQLASELRPMMAAK